MDEHIDLISEIRAIADVLSVVDQQATLQTETVNRLGDLIKDLSDDVLNIYHKE